MPERLPAADEIVRHTEIKTFRRGHLQRETAFAPALKLLRAGELKFVVVADVVADYFLQHFVN